MQDTVSTLQESSTNISLREYGDVLRRRRAIILQTFVIVLVIGILVNLYTPLTYQASARLLLEAPRFSINSVNTSDPLADLFSVNQQYSMGTQVQMLQRGEIRAKVREQLNISSLPQISVRVIEGTQIIEVSAEGESPEEVSGTPNTLLEIYRKEVSDKNAEKITKTLTFAQDRAKDARERLLGFEQMINQFKSKWNLLDVNRNREELMDRLSKNTAAYENGLIRLRTIEGRILATDAELRKEQKIIRIVANQKSDPKIQAKEEQIEAITLQMELLEIGEGLAKEHPQILRLKKQRAKLEEQLQKLNRSFVERNQTANPVFRKYYDQIRTQNLERRVQLATLASIQNQINGIKAELSQFPKFERTWADLQRKFDRAKRDYDYYTQQESVLSLRKETAGSGGPVIIQQATTPTNPIRPNREQNIVFAALLGIFFGLCLAVLQELFDDRINSPEEAERVLRLPNLGMIPLIEEEGLRLIKDTSAFSPLMESYRTLRTNINFAAVGTPVRSLVVTSSVPAEGKSVTVSNLATAMAMENKKVIIVDADLRRPSLHKLFKVESSPGLTDVLVGNATVEQVIHPTDVKNVFIVPAGSPPPNPAELLGSAVMGHFLATLESMCDVALFDSPPVRFVADSSVLASRVNGVLLVVGYGETKKADTRKAIEILSRANANILGTVLNRVEGPSSGYYYGKYYVPVSDRNRAGGNGTGATPALPAGQSALTDGKSSTDLTGVRSETGGERESEYKMDGGDEKN